MSAWISLAFLSCVVYGAIMTDHEDVAAAIMWDHEDVAATFNSAENDPAGVEQLGSEPGPDASSLHDAAMSSG